MKQITRSQRVTFVALAVLGIGAVGTYLLGNAFHRRSPKTDDARQGGFVDVVSAAALHRRPLSQHRLPSLAAGHTHPTSARPTRTASTGESLMSTPASPSTQECLG